jgi:hypothetical protein
MRLAAELGSGLLVLSLVPPDKRLQRTVRYRVPSCMRQCPAANRGVIRRWKPRDWRFQLCGPASH